MSLTVPQATSRVALTTRYKGADAPETIEARRDLAEAKIGRTIAEVVAEAPPLTTEQLDRLHRILDGGAR